jgi:hypothetical protein
MPRQTLAQWVAQGKAAIVALLKQEHAAVWPEIEAKLTEDPGRVDPHHLTTARIGLLRDQVIEQVVASTRGGGLVAVLALTDRTNQRAFEDAASRKRLLYARYINWSGRYYGPAGERVVHASLSAAAPLAGYRLFEPRGLEVKTIFGQPVPVGPLDSGATLQLVDPHGFPVGNAVVLIEVKNVHHWVYPSPEELYQLLEKAALLQLAHPTLDFVPVLVCRRGHPTLFKMAKDLGFFVADARVQYVLPVKDVPEHHVAELRTELGMIDLVRPVLNPAYPERWTPYESKRLIRLFSSDLPQVVQRSAERFKKSAPMLAPLVPALKIAKAGRLQNTLMANLRRTAKLGGFDGGW